jgi:hypothetical protein
MSDNDIRRHHHHEHEHECPHKGKHGHRCERCDFDLLQITTRSHRKLEEQERIRHEKKLKEKCYFEKYQIGLDNNEYNSFYLHREYQNQHPHHHSPHHHPHHHSPHHDHHNSPHHEHHHNPHHEHHHDHRDHHHNHRERENEHYKHCGRIDIRKEIFKN